MSHSGETPVPRCHVTWSNWRVVCSLFALVALGPSTSTHGRKRPPCLSTARSRISSDRSYPAPRSPSLTSTPARFIPPRRMNAARTGSSVCGPAPTPSRSNASGFKTTIAANVPTARRDDHQAESAAGGGRHRRDRECRGGEHANQQDRRQHRQRAFAHQIRNLPIEAQNVVHLLSLQPGAVFIPQRRRRATKRTPGTVRSTGARADQQNVTLDGVDVNDPQLQSAYTSAVRMTQEALQEFRVSTGNYSADMGRSSGPQVVARHARAARTNSTAPATGPSVAPRRRATSTS